jgi:hypothetical protein
VKPNRMAANLAVPWALGFVAGGLTAGGVYDLYPPVRGHMWPMGVLVVASVLFVLGVYFAAARLGAARAGDSLVVGYGLALVLAASLVVTREFVHALREHVPQTLGVKRVGLSRVEVPVV